MKKTNKKYIFLVVGLLIILTFFIFLDNKINTFNNYSFSKDLGVVKSSVKSVNFINKIFIPIENAVLFANTNAEPGDTINFKDELTVSGLPSNQVISEYQIHIQKPDNDKISFFNLIPTSPLKNGEKLLYNSQITVDQEGTWSATSVYTIGQCSDIVNKQGCFSTSNTFSQGSTNTILVQTAQPQTCTTEDKWSDWIFSKNITNGKIDKRNWLVYSDPNCDESIDHSEYRTVCNVDYVVENSADNIGTGELNCVQKTPDSANNNTNTCTACTDDVTLTCDDGTVIIEKRCVNSCLVNNNQVCKDDTYKENDINYKSIFIVGSLIVFMFIITIGALYYVKKKK